MAHLGMSIGPKSVSSVTLDSLFLLRPTSSPSLCEPLPLTSPHSSPTAHCLPPSGPNNSWSVVVSPTLSPQSPLLLFLKNSLLATSLLRLNRTEVERLGAVTGTPGMGGSSWPVILTTPCGVTLLTVDSRLWGISQVQSVPHHRLLTVDCGVTCRHRRYRTCAATSPGVGGAVPVLLNHWNCFPFSHRAGGNT